MLAQFNLKTAPKLILFWPWPHIEPRQYHISTLSSPSLFPDSAHFYLQTSW
eukprot:c30276_g1_i1 orf=2-151(-)